MNPQTPCCHTPDCPARGQIGQGNLRVHSLTEHRWTRPELMRYQVPLPSWVAPKRRGRPPKRALQLAIAAA
jgi:hypothetical protein